MGTVQLRLLHKDVAPGNFMCYVSRRSRVPAESSLGLTYMAEQRCVFICVLAVTPAYGYVVYMHSNRNQLHGATPDSHSCNAHRHDASKSTGCTCAHDTGPHRHIGPIVAGRGSRQVLHPNTRGHL